MNKGFPSCNFASLAVKFQPPNGATNSRDPGHRTGVGMHIQFLAGSERYQRGFLRKTAAPAATWNERGAMCI